VQSSEYFIGHPTAHVEAENVEASTSAGLLADT